MSATLSRRAALIGVAASGFAPWTGAAMAASVSRELVLLRGDSEIGGKSVAVRREGDVVTVETRIDIAARLFGFPVYRYRLSAREVWGRGVLQSLRAQTDDNGTTYVANADRSAGGLQVEGTEYAGAAPADAATTSYWSPAFLARPVWISTQDGRLLSVTTTNLGRVQYPAAGGSVEATRWRIGGDLSDLYLYYDDADEWVGTEFTARGETARFVTASRGGALTPLWVNA